MKGKGRQTLLLGLLVGAVTAALPLSTSYATHTMAMASIAVTNDISAVPPGDDMQASPVAFDDKDIKASAATAAAAAEQAFGLSDSDIDASTGAVLTSLTQPGTPSIQNEKVWIVVSNTGLASAAPQSPGRWAKLAVVVSATTGQALFAYGSDWQPSSVGVDSGSPGTSP